MGATVLMGLAAVVATSTLSVTQAFSGFSHDVIWLILFACFIARGIIKTGLGARLGYGFIYLFGRHSLGLGYSLVATDLLLSPAIPSVTARAGGIILPILESIAEAVGSHPHSGSSRRLGSFLIQVLFQSSCITGALFLTSMSANLLIAQSALELSVEMDWGSWALASLVPGLFHLLVMPLLLYLLHPPELTQLPMAKELARHKLEEIGSLTRPELIMLIVFSLLILLWAIGPRWGIAPVTTALLGVVSLLLTGVLSWRDLLREETAWDTFIWFSILLMMASWLSKLGVTQWLGQLMACHTTGFSPAVSLLLLTIVYFYAHYLFASNLAHVGAMYATFLSVAIALEVPPALAAYLLAFSSSLFGCLTHYSSGPAALLFGMGYVTLADWWKLGLLFSFISLTIWGTIGLFWWRAIGLW